MGLPKFFFDNRLADAAVAASSTAAGNYDAANVSDMRSYTWWKPSAMLATLTVDCGTAKPADFGIIYGQGDKAQFRASNDNFAINNSGTAQAAAAASLTLPAGASSVTDYYAGMTARILSGAGGEQERTVLTSRVNQQPNSEDVSAAGWSVAYLTIGTGVTLNGVASKRCTLTGGAVGHYISGLAPTIGRQYAFRLVVDVTGLTTKYLAFENGGSVVSFTWTSPTAITVTGAGTATVIGSYEAILEITNSNPVSAVHACYIGAYGTYSGDGEYVDVTQGYFEQDVAVCGEYIKTGATAAVGVAVAPWSTNLWINSETFSGWTLSGFTSASGSGVLIDGVASTRMTMNAGSSLRYIAYGVGFSAGLKGWDSIAVDVTGLANKRVYFESGGTSFIWTGPRSISIIGDAASYAEVLGDYQAILHCYYPTSGTANAIYFGLVAAYTPVGAEYVDIRRAQRSINTVVELPYITTTATAIALPDSTSVYEIMSSDVLLGEVHPTTNGLYLSEFAAVSYRYYRVRFPGTTVPTIAMAMIGSALEFPEYLTDQFDPIGRAVVTQADNQNEDGQPLGKIIDFEKWKATVEIDFLTWAWLRDIWQPAWRSSLRGSPAIFAWNPADYPDELYLVTLGDNYQTPHSGAFAKLIFDVSGVAT